MFFVNVVKIVKKLENLYKYFVGGLSHYFLSSKILKIIISQNIIEYYTFDIKQYNEISHTHTHLDHIRKNAYFGYGNFPNNSFSAQILLFVRSRHEELITNIKFILIGLRCILENSIEFVTFVAGSEK